MRGNSRHGALRPAQPPGAARPAGRVDAQLLAGLLEPAVTDLGMDLEGVRVTSAGRRRLLRVVVDADGGVSLDDIEHVSRELSAVLDQAAAMGEAPYTLEVSSPGVDRPLTEPRHWRRAVGRLVTAPLARRAQPSPDEPEAAAGPASVHGRVSQADASGVTLDVQGDSRRFSYGDLGPGRIQIEFARLDDAPDDGADEEEPDGY
jgi:ribosome maturation factor RimP